MLLQDTKYKEYIMSGAYGQMFVQLYSGSAHR